MQSLLYDLHYAFRTLRKSPMLTAVALVSLGIGIGANTAIFSIMDRVLLRTLPIRNADQLVLFRSSGGWSGFIDTQYGDEVSFSWPKYRALRDQSGQILDGLIARFPFTGGVTSQGQSENQHAEMVSGNYFDVLGVRPTLGRLFTNEDAQKPGANPVTVLSHAYWTRRFGASSSVLNQVISVNGHPLTVVGVAQQGFRSVGSGESPAFFVPVTMQATMMPGFEGVFEAPHGYWLNIFGRLKPNMSREQTQAALDVVWRRIVQDDVKQLSPRATQAFRTKYVNRKLDLLPAGTGISSFRDSFAVPLYLLMGMVGLVLLIACANVANLLLARAAAREKEIAIRMSLGASRGRLIRHLLVESMILSIGGGLVGILVAWWAGSLMFRLLPDSLPTAGISPDPDGRMLVFTFVVSVLTGLLFGCIPALRGTRPDLAPALKEQTATLHSSGHARFRKSIVIGQIALSTLLLASAGLFARSLLNLRNLNPGFRSDHLITFSINPALNGYKPDRSLRFLQDVQRALEANPGMSQAAMAKWSLLTNTMDMGGYEVEGYQPATGKNLGLHRNFVSKGFFSMMGIPLLAGREFRDGDSQGALPVAIINESLARKCFEGRNPIGLHITPPSKKPVNYEIVGVVKDIKHDDLRDKPTPFVYFSAAQDDSVGPMTFYVRTQLTPERLSPPLRQVVRNIDPAVPLDTVKSMTAQVMESVYLDRMVAALSSVFASLATVLAAVGLYGVIAWAVTRRKREIGIRIAMGAHSSDIMRMVLSEVLLLGIAGIAIAAPVWLVSARLLESQLYGVTSRDPVTLAGSILVLTLVAGAAGFVPAFRASRVEPITAIRYE